ncbi:hypothetical protein E2C01_059393 [Portunus trituberculatus]|uniref:Uncharacterized protein n=1 Tax=Portunus trituberculatus TaxID=210409 RepID=A0A5B7GZ03_PORTR|nr:hypothetical protein [Portunus trituberculatus]
MNGESVPALTLTKAIVCMQCDSIVTEICHQPSDLERFGGRIFGLFISGIDWAWVFVKVTEI